VGLAAQAVDYLIIQFNLVRHIRFRPIELSDSFLFRFVNRHFKFLILEGRRLLQFN
jgi:hypothetical protein